MTSKKMLYVRSDDFWGYDSSDFDTALNFYTYSWVVPKAMYEGMNDSDQSRLFPCALFYVQGVTDNHNFLTLSVDVDGDVAKVRGMQGAARRTRNFEVGVPFSYQVGSLTMKEAPAGSENISEVEEAVKDGSATSEGTFIISQFLTDADSIAEAVGLTAEAEAEGFVSPLEDPATPSGYEPESSATNPMEESFSSEEISDAYPQESAQTGGESSGRGVPVAYGSGSSQNLEPPVIVDEEMAAEEVSDVYPQSSAEVGGVASGRGVPISYGSGSSQNVEPPTIEDMGAEEVSDFYPQSSAEIDGESSGRGVPVSYGSGSSQNVGPPVVVVDDDYMAFEATEDPESFNAETEIVETGLPVIPNSFGNDSATEMGGRGVPTWYGSAEYGAEWQHGRRGAGGRFRNKRDVRNEVFGESVANEMRGYWRTGIVGTDPVVGDDVARSNPQKRFNYFSKPAVYDENTRNWSKGPNYRQAHKIAKGVAWRRVEKLGLAAEAEVLVAESNFDKLADKIAAQYRKKGKSAKEAMRIGRATAYTIGAKKYGPQGMAAKASAGRRRAKMAAEDYVYEEIPSNPNDTNPIAYARLGAYDIPVISNSLGGDSAAGSGYGVPQWYGADTFEGDRMVDNFEESAPPRLPIKGVMAALIGVGIGVWYAKRTT